MVMITHPAFVCLYTKQNRLAYSRTRGVCWRIFYSQWSRASTRLLSYRTADKGEILSDWAGVKPSYSFTILKKAPTHQKLDISKRNLVFKIPDGTETTKEREDYWNVASTCSPPLHAIRYGNANFMRENLQMMEEHCYFQRGHSSPPWILMEKKFPGKKLQISDNKTTK